VLKRDNAAKNGMACRVMLELAAGNATHNGIVNGRPAGDCGGRCKIDQGAAHHCIVPVQCGAGNDAE
jgi:hypothetical protein